MSPETAVMKEGGRMPQGPEGSKISRRRSLSTRSRALMPFFDRAITTILSMFSTSRLIIKSLRSSPPTYPVTPVTRIL